MQVFQIDGAVLQVSRAVHAVDQHLGDAVVFQRIAGDSRVGHALRVGLGVAPLFVLDRLTVILHHHAADRDFRHRHAFGRVGDGVLGRVGLTACALIRILVCGQEVLIQRQRDRLKAGLCGVLVHGGVLRTEGRVVPLDLGVQTVDLYGIKASTGFFHKGLRLVAVQIPCKAVASGIVCTERRLKRRIVWIALGVALLVKFYGFDLNAVLAVDVLDLHQTNEVHRHGLGGIVRGGHRHGDLQPVAAVFKHFQLGFFRPRCHRQLALVLLLGHIVITAGIKGILVHRLVQRIGLCVVIYLLPEPFDVTEGRITCAACIDFDGEGCISLSSRIIDIHLVGIGERGGCGHIQTDFHLGNIGIIFFNSECYAVSLLNDTHITAVDIKIGKGIFSLGQPEGSLTVKVGDRFVGIFCRCIGFVDRNLYIGTAYHSVIRLVPHRQRDFIERFAVFVRRLRA